MKKHTLNPQSPPNYYPKQLDFREQTPKPLIFREKTNRSYEKAFLSPEADTDREYCRNTATWD